MKCPECGRNFPETATICSHCGLSREEALELVWEQEVYEEDIVGEDYSSTEIA